MHATFRPLSMALAMGWEILWPLLLGFALSAVAQAVGSSEQRGGTSSSDLSGRLEPPARLG